LFSLSFSVYAFTNLATLDTTFRAEAAHYTELAIQKTLTTEISGFSRTSDSPPFRLDTAGSVLYLGHLNLMLGCHRSLNPASCFAALHDTLSRVLYGRYLRTPSHCLNSYPGLAWITDNTVALASLGLHSQITGSTYERYCRQWVAYARQHLTDSASGLLISRPSSSQDVAEGPCGAMLGWSIYFLYRFDPAYAAEQYRRYQEQASTSFGAIRLYRERVGSYETSTGDVDSGPLILGYSIPANAFAFGNAVALRDWCNAQRLRRVISLGSREVATPQELYYRVRFVDLSVSPLAEALILNAETMTPWRITSAAAAPTARQ
jgi:post-segregation antitoxin (ccd killing protein)